MATDKEIKILKDKIESLEKVIQGLTGVITELHALLTSKEMIKKLEREEWEGRTHVSPANLGYTFINNNQKAFKSSLGNYQNRKRERLERIWKQ